MVGARGSRADEHCLILSAAADLVELALIVSSI